jgi:hypothetical protein
MGLLLPVDKKVEGRGDIEETGNGAACGERRSNPQVSHLETASFGSLNSLSLLAVTAAGSLRENAVVEISAF